MPNARIGALAATAKPSWPTSCSRLNWRDEPDVDEADDGHSIPPGSGMRACDARITHTSANRLVITLLIRMRRHSGEGYHPGRPRITAAVSAQRLAIRMGSMGASVLKILQNAIAS